MADDPRYRFVQGDIADADAVAAAAEGCDAIINAAAETHVDRSIMGGDEFVTTNILGAKRLLDWVATHEGVRLLHVSTDEVYGDIAAPHRSREGDNLHGSSPYAAAKAAAELMVFAYVRTYGINALDRARANAYGPNQFPEKFIPVLAINTLEGRPLPVYGDGQQVREFTHVGDFAAGIETVLLHGSPGEAYNCGSEEAQVNLETARRVVAILDADEELIHHVADRPGHDRRYAIDCTKLRSLGWSPHVGFETGLRETVEVVPRERAVVAGHPGRRRLRGVRGGELRRPGRRVKGIILAGGAGTRLHPRRSASPSSCCPCTTSRWSTTRCRR